VVGETPNIAARLQALAQPNAIVVGRAPISSSRGCMSARISAPQQLKGISHPCGPTGFCRKAESRAASRRELPRGIVAAGWDAKYEIGILLKRWQQAHRARVRPSLSAAKRVWGSRACCGGSMTRSRHTLPNSRRLLWSASVLPAIPSLYAVFRRDRTTRAQPASSPEATARRRSSTSSSRSYRIWALRGVPFVPPLAALLGMQVGERVYGGSTLHQRTRQEAHLRGDHGGDRRHDPARPGC